MSIRKFSKIFLFSLSVVFCFPLSSFSQTEETFTTTTYYPAPYGVYNEMRSRRMAIGDTWFNAAGFCWAADPSCVPDNIDANADLVVEGNVGIGTLAPGGTLDVNGTIFQRGAALHADYVFEPGYELEPIEEHSQYMWANQHLKAVPKAQKDESGQDMVEYGAHNRGILEELEKAHVYIQQLNERVKVLEARLAKQG